MYICGLTNKKDIKIQIKHLIYSGSYTVCEGKKINIQLQINHFEI